MVLEGQEFDLRPAPAASHSTACGARRGRSRPYFSAAAAGISRTSSGVSQPSPAAPTVVLEHGTQTLAIVFASTALGIALAGAAFMLMAVYRRPRRAWSAPY